MSACQHVHAPTGDVPARAVLWRKCACGANSGPIAQSCPDCEHKRVQPKLVVGSQHAAEEREADRVADAVMQGGGDTTPAIGAISRSVQRAGATEAASDGSRAPPIVDRVLSRAGQPLDSEARQFFEARFERDFSNVRVHDGAEAAASARAVDAHAYTVGNHLVFGASRYAPDTFSGRRLLAHELAHVAQQGEMLRRNSISDEPILDGDRDPDGEEPVAVVRRLPAVVGLAEAGHRASLTKDHGSALTACMKDKVDPEPCDPSTPPGWASFTGPVPAQTDYVAAIHSEVVPVDVPSQQCLDTATGGSTGTPRRFQGRFYPGTSWVEPRLRNAGDPILNGSAQLVASCKAYFAGGGTDPRFLNSLPPTCAASIRPRKDKAHNATECETVLGKDYTDMEIAESARVLRHERLHLELSCAIARKANEALDIGQHSFDDIKAVAEAKHKKLQDQYDGITDHGCLSNSQSAWAAYITAGLPSLKLF